MKNNNSKYYDDEDFKVKLNSLNNGLCTLSLNCQSINAKFDKLKLFLDDVTHKILYLSYVSRSHGVTKKLT